MDPAVGRGCLRRSVLLSRPAFVVAPRGNPSCVGALLGVLFAPARLWYSVLPRRVFEVLSSCVTCVTGGAHCGCFYCGVPLCGLRSAPNAPFLLGKCSPYWWCPHVYSSWRVFPAPYFLGGNDLIAPPKLGPEYPRLRVMIPKSGISRATKGVSPQRVTQWGPKYRGEPSNCATEE